MASDLVAVENRLWATADQLWANTGLKPSEFSTPVLGLIFLRYADKRFTDLTQALAAQGTPADEIDAVDYQAEGVLYLPEQARFSHLLTLTEGASLGKAIATAMALVEQHNPLLKGVLPRGYNLLPNATLVELLRLLAPLDLDKPQDAQQARQASQVAVDDTLQVWHLASAPRVKLIRREEIHADQHVDRRHDLAACKQSFDRARDPRIQRVCLIGGDARRCGRGCL